MNTVNYKKLKINSSPILKQWELNKSHIYNNFFNKQLIIKIPVKIELEKQDDYTKKQFLSKGSKFEDLIDQIDGISLVKNYLQKDTTIFNQVYPKGMKITRIFKKIMKNNDFVIIDRIYGNVLKNLFTQGNLCFSIDPVDFLTMGDNNSKWTSCHSLQGEFKGGLLGLLIDNATIVCYLEMEELFSYKNKVKINDKKWRVLFHINETHDFGIFNNAYPYYHNILMQMAGNEICKLFKKESDFLSLSSNKILPNCVKDVKPSDYNDPLHYNDLLLKSDNTNYEMSTVKIVAEKELIKNNFKNVNTVTIGDFPFCPVCGKHMIDHHKSLECDFCNPMENCCTCANRFHEEELHVIESELYCDNCYDDEFTHCEESDELVRRRWPICV